MNLSTKYVFEISQEGAEQLRAHLKGIGADFKETKKGADEYSGSLGKSGESNKDLSKWISENRKESKEQNYLFNQSRNSLLLLTSVTSGFTSVNSKNSQEIRNVANTLNQSIFVFSSAEFAVKGLASALGFSAGGVATAIAGVLALSTAIIAFLQNVNAEAKKASEEGLKDFADKLKEIATFKIEKGKGEIEKELAEQIAIRQKFYTKMNEMRLLKTPEEVKKWKEENAELTKKLAIESQIADKKIKYLEKLKDNTESQIKTNKLLETEKILKEYILSTMQGIKELAVEVGLVSREEQLQELKATAAIIEARNRSAVESVLGVGKYKKALDNELLPVLGKIKKIEKEILDERMKAIMDMGNLSETISKFAPIESPRVPSILKTQLPKTATDEELRLDMGFARDKKQLKLAKDINDELEKRQEILRRNNLLMMTEYELNVELVNQLQQGFGGLNTIIQTLGINENTALAQMIGGVQKLLSIWQAILAVKEAIAAIEMISNIFFPAKAIKSVAPVGALIGHQGNILTAHQGLTLPSTYMGKKEVMVKAYEGEEIISTQDSRHRYNRYNKGGGGGITVNYNISANDVKSFESYIMKPEHKRALLNAIASARRVN